MSNRNVCQAYYDGETDKHGSNIYIDGQTIFSYGRHFPMAVRLQPNIYVWNEDKYSVTTSKHQSYAYVRDGKIIYANTTIASNWATFMEYESNKDHKYSEARAYQENIEYLENKIALHTDMLSCKRKEWTKNWEREQIQKYTESLDLLRSLDK